MIKTDMLDAIVVKFLKPFSEADFPERGMKAWLTKIIWDTNNRCYKLFFDFTDFEQENDKYLTEVYYSNIHTKNLPQKDLYTAKEAGWYFNKYNVFFYTSDESENDELFNKEITSYLVIVK